jgi:hypothetical protein
VRDATRAARRCVGTAVVVLLLTSCTSSTEPPTAAPPPSSSGPSSSGPSTTPSAPESRTGAPTAAATGSTPAEQPSHPRPKLDHWDIGAHPLPLRPDGFGEVLPTPTVLRVRRMPTHDFLPAPQDRRFHSTVGPVSARIRHRMGETWSPRCPVPLADLRYLTVTFQGFDERPHTGELVVNASVARDVVGVFRKLYAARFPIEEMRLPTTADLEAPPTGDGNDTAALVCRATRGQTTWSAHAYGLAIDLNPFMNPYSKGDLVLPELASAYLDRSWRRPGMVLDGGVVTRAFASIGWTWGGHFESLKDRMHFSATGR